VQRNLLRCVAIACFLGVAGDFVRPCDAAPLISGFVDGFRNRFQWRVYADNAPDNPQPTAGQFTYVYWQQAVGGEIPLHQITLTGGTINHLGTLSATGIIPFTGVEPDSFFLGNWIWDDVTLTQGQRTSSLYVTSPHPPGQIGALVYNCDPIICDIGTTPTIGPVTPPPPPGDLNHDGIVDPEDYDTWKAAFGTSDYGADANKNGIVDAADYTIWRDHLPSTFDTAFLSAEAIPEPTSLLSTLITITAFCLLRRR
jgi:hypothetical protein